MKKIGIIVIALSVLVIGMALAEPGIPKVNEVQGLTTSTTVIAAGNFNAASSVDLTISKLNPITNMPPVGDPNGLLYQSVYTEDTQNSEVGFISYDKDLDVSTANKVSGQYNILAVKQITYLGVDASSVVTNDFLMEDGAGELYGNIDDLVICPFAGNIKVPSFCNRVETGSNMNLKVANLNTQMGDRFIMKSADPGVAVFNNVGVSSYATDLPSKGSVSAFIRGSIKEGGRDGLLLPTTGDSSVSQLPFEDQTDLYETLVFSDSTGISGDITTFAKSMVYNSVFSAEGGGATPATPGS
jgi:hypothetical protein